MSKLVLIYTLFGDADEARRVSALLIAEKMAACANMLAPCTSLYEWQGEMREETEFPVLFKTIEARHVPLTTRLTELHSYDIPAILCWNAAVNSPYVEWAGQQIDGQR
ncbi:divalent-cation tolerance protein CutA [Rhizorhapis sp. SPR117]|uniref:divalent-cation tolerance protein CutA n=1 Tax=Rhizorhapis sp. SPR117 TaxID=2912611 RepID=UPI001F181285|nr:divalent-cation tolerance protein CutA [Rhizorhapis sp. SPR117]